MKSALVGAETPTWGILMEIKRILRISLGVCYMSVGARKSMEKKQSRADRKSTIAKNAFVGAETPTLGFQVEVQRVLRISLGVC